MCFGYQTVLPLVQISERKQMKFSKIILSVALAASALVLTGCGRDADIASRNLSVAADQFQIDRRVVFYNGITGEYMLTVEGRCSLGNNDSAGQLTITCKTGEDMYKKHFLGLSDNVTYFVEQLESKGVSAYHYKVIFKPQSIIPDVDFKGKIE
jgi:hypothetical protein